MQRYPPCPLNLWKRHRQRQIDRRIIDFDIELLHACLTSPPPNFNGWATRSSLASRRCRHGALVTFVNLHTSLFGSQRQSVKRKCASQSTCLILAFASFPLDPKENQLALQSLSLHLQMRATAASLATSPITALSDMGASPKGQSGTHCDPSPGATTTIVSDNVHGLQHQDCAFLSWPTPPLAHDSETHTKQFRHQLRVIRLTSFRDESTAHMIAPSPILRLMFRLCN